MSDCNEYIRCSICGGQFIVNVNERELLKASGNPGQPKCCPACSLSGNLESVSNKQDNRPMSFAICQHCGKYTEVPFKASVGKPVYCRECYSLHQRGLL